MLRLTVGSSDPELRDSGVDCLTLGKYMQPTKRHLKVRMDQVTHTHTHPAWRLCWVTKTVCMSIVMAIPLIYCV